MSSDIRKWFLKQHDKNADAAKPSGAAGKKPVLSIPENLAPSSVPGDQDPSARSKTSKYFASKTEKDPNVKEEDASVGKSTDKSLSKRKFQKSRDELEDDIKTLPTKKVHKDEDGDNDFVAPSRKSLLLRLWLTIQ